MTFQRRAVFRQLKRLHRLVKENHPVRVAHRNRCDFKPTPQGRDRRPLDDALPQQARHSLAIKNRRAHIDADALCPPVFNGQVQRLHAGIGFQRHHRLIRHAPVVDIFPDAPAGVAAHRPARTVCIVHHHAEIRLVARRDQHQPVAADPKVPVAEAARQRGRVVHPLLKRIDIDVIVAKPLHFGEFHARRSLPSRSIRPTLYCSRMYAVFPADPHKNRVVPPFLDRDAKKRDRRFRQSLPIFGFTRPWPPERPQPCRSRRTQSSRRPAR